jgi:tellurite resistance protein
MFLNQLTEEEKKAFLEMAHHVAEVDGMVNEQEQLVMEMYKQEMELEGYVILNKSLDETLSVFSSEKSKNIALLELIGLVFADNSGYNDAEREVMKEIKQSFGLSIEKYESYKAWIHQFNEVYQKGLVLINE